VKFVLDAGNAEPTDANLALTLGGCARPPRSDEHPAIRMHVDTYRMAQMSATDAVRDTLRERAESYWRDANKIHPAKRDGAPVTGSDESDQRWSVCYLTIAAELRKAADAL
jgi:hypothetical protein